MTRKERLTRKRAALIEKMRRVGGEIGVMAHTPQYDPHYSQAKLDDWQREYSQLEGQLEAINGQLLDIAIAGGGIS